MGDAQNETELKNLITCLLMCAINVVTMRMAQADVITQNPVCDVDGNGVVDIGDLLMVVGNWGPCE